MLSCAHGQLPLEPDAAQEDEEMDDVDGEPGRQVGENRRQVLWIWTATGVCGTDADFEDGKLKWREAEWKKLTW
jgi:hypothetical protein